MDVKINIFQTPKPSGREGEIQEHARVQSKGTRRLVDICEKLIPQGLNTAQIKGILDGLAVYIGESLRDGYHIELEDIGTFSLSVKTHPAEDPKKMIVEVDSVNFKCSPKLKQRAKRAKLAVHKQSAASRLPLIKRKKNLLEYLQKNGSISVRGYARLNNCSDYQAKKDLDVFEEERVVELKGKGTHKIYIIQL